MHAKVAIVHCLVLTDPNQGASPARARQSNAPRAMDPTFASVEITTNTRASSDSVGAENSTRATINKLQAAVNKLGISVILAHNVCHFCPNTFLRICVHAHHICYIRSASTSHSSLF